MAAKLEIPNINNIIERYKSGVSLNQLSKETGIARITLTRRFKSLYVYLRSQSESESLKWSKMSEQQRKRQVQKAHQSTRGRFVSTSEKIKRAKSAYQNAFKAGLFEQEIIDIINEIRPDIKAVCQKDFGIYNIDISFHGLPIFVEVQVSNHHFLIKPKNAKRVKHILNSEKFLLYVIIEKPNKRVFLESIANKILTYCDLISRDKTIIGKYSMIGRDGNPFSSSRYNFKGFTRIE